MRCLLLLLLVGCATTQTPYKKKTAPPKIAEVRKNISAAEKSIDSAMDVTPVYSVKKPAIIFGVLGLGIAIVCVGSMVNAKRRAD